MIEFGCTGCSKQFRVSDSHAGKKAKCPTCHSILIVPLHSENELIFDENELRCKDPRLQRVYEAIVKEVGDRIRKHSITENDLLIFEITTSPYDTRTQIVCACIINPDKDHWDDMFLLFSQVGTIAKPEDAFTALRMADLYPFVNICVNDDNELSIRMVADINTSTDKLWLHFMHIAISADKLEELIFSWDMK